MDRIDGIRLKEDDLNGLKDLAEVRTLPLRTLARELLTKAIREEVERDG